MGSRKNQFGLCLIAYSAGVIYLVPVVGIPVFETEVFTGISLWFVTGWVSMIALAAVGLLYSYVLAEVSVNG